MPGASAQSGSYQTVHDAVKHSDVLQLEIMIKNGASINEVEPRDKFTPLHTACNFGALECVHWLLWHGADATIITQRGWTPAHIAAIRGFENCMEALANNGVSLLLKDQSGQTPLHLAAAHGHSFCLSTILRSGADVTCKDSLGWSPVHAAVYHGRLGCIQLLLKWGGLPNDEDQNGNTPAHLAASEGHLPCLKFLVCHNGNAKAVLSARNDHGETPKDLAQRFYKNNILEYISHVEYEEDHPEQEENFSFPAHVAAYSGDLARVQMLVENGVVNINERDDKGSTLAHKAAGQGHLHILQWLLEMGANMNVTNQAGETPQDLASRFAQLGCVKLLGGFRSDGEEENILGLSSASDSEEDRDGARRKGRRSKRSEENARSRAKAKMDELGRLLDIARKNFQQLGGSMEEDNKRLKEIRDKDQTIHELEAQLEYERLKREKLEAQLDEYRREIGELQIRIEDMEVHMHLAEGLQNPAAQSKKKKKKQLKKKTLDEGEFFIRRNVTNASSETQYVKIA